MELLDASRQASARLLTGAVKQPRFAAGGDPKAEARTAAWARGRLALTALGREAVEAQAERGGGLVPRYPFIEKDLLDLRNMAAGDPMEWGKLAARVDTVERRSQPPKQEAQEA